MKNLFSLRSTTNRLLLTAAMSAAMSTGALAGDANGNLFARWFQYRPFKRIASIPVFENTDIDEETVAEIVDATDDGTLLVYTDGATGNIGFVDITDPYQPQADGVVGVAGEPTSVAVIGDYALAAINTSDDFVNPSGELVVIDIASRTIRRSIDLGGQPDAVAISPDGRYAGVIIENERDEDLGDGEPPQLPGGFVVIVDLAGDVADWTTRTVDLTGVCDLFPEDPEPEYIDINALNVAVVTCQENNHIILIDMVGGSVIWDYPAGTVDLTNVDDNENDLIELDAALNDVPREPDAVAWTSLLTFATADEGDLFGGSRGFTTFLTWGLPLFQPGNALEHTVVRLGHYPENRSENKGNEPEGVEVGRYGLNQLLFVGSERSSVIFVYDLGFGFLIGNAYPRLVQVLPAGGVGPEGLLAIPHRDLFVAACEEDSRDDKIRSVISIYKRGDDTNYPTVRSANRADGLPIPWAALSGMAALGDQRTVYTVHDSFYRKSRAYRMDVSTVPAVIEEEIVLHDAHDVLIDALNDLKAQLPGTDDFDPDDAVNGDGTVNLDLEGIAIGKVGGWLASEGAGNLEDGVSDLDDQPFASPNMLVHAMPNGVITDVVMLPLHLTRNQLRFGFEGVAVMGQPGHEVLYVAFQRAWQDAGDPGNRARIGRYDTATDAWTFAYYPLDAPTSANGGWVGLSELTHLGDGVFAVVERDNQGGPDAAIKRIYTFSVDGVEFMDDGDVPDFDVVAKSLARDLLVEGDFDVTGGLVPEKIEGMAVLPNGDVLIVNDNDGVDDNNGETQLLRLGDIVE
jgi:hypothetical protein